MAQKKRRRKKLDTSKLVCFLLVGSGLLITQECIYLMRLCIKSNYMASAAWLTAALSLAQVIIITGGKCYFELVKSDHKRGGITFEAAKANGFQEQDASDNVGSAFIWTHEQTPRMAEVSCEGFSFLRGSGGSLRRFYICPLILSSLCAA